MNDLGKLVGERIRNLRKQSGISQEELGQRADLHPKYISTIERAEKNVSLESIDKIVSALGISLEEFFRNIKPIAESHDEFATKLYNLVIDMSAEDQCFLVEHLEAMINWKKVSY